MKVILATISFLILISCGNTPQADKESPGKTDIQNNSTPITVKQAILGDGARYLETLISANPEFDIEQLSGKTIYVDNWATWCVPCIKSNKKFIEQYNQINQIKDIVFVFVSFDLKEEKWRSYIKDQFPQSENIVHLYSGFEMNNDYSNYYGINALPRYFVIDTLGDIVDLQADSASDVGFINYLKEL